MVNELIDDYRKKPTDDLLKVLVVDPAAFTAEAKEAAAAVLAERGVSVEAERKRLDERARAARQLADQARREVEQAREDLVRSLGKAGRGDGTCPVCRARAATREVRVTTQRSTGVQYHGSTEVHACDVLPVPLSVCEGCADRHEKSGTRAGPSWPFAVAFFGSLAWGLAGWFVLAEAGLPGWLTMMLVTGPFVLMLLFGGVEWARRTLVASKLFKAHPMAAKLRAMGYSAVSDLDRGTRAIDFHAATLKEMFSSLRDHAEAELIAIGGSEVVALALELLANKAARRPALRILAALRATDAVEDIRRLAETDSSGLTRDVAREALENLGEV